MDFLAQLDADIDAFAAAVRLGPLDAPVAACPGWDVADLATHLGVIHRWVIGGLLAGGPPPPSSDDPAPTTAHELAQWVRDGGTRLIGMLAPLAPDDPVWHPFPVPRVARVWPRRQAQEASVHRWDVEHAVGLPASISPAMGADGIDEYLGVMLPRLIVREGLSIPASTVRIVADDTGDEWTVDGRGGSVAPAAAADADATIRGDASALLLRVWGRPVAAGLVAVEGDADVAARWLALGGA